MKDNFYFWETNEKDICESETAAALSVLLTNVLILAIIGSVVRLAHSTVTKTAGLNAFLHGGFLHNTSDSFLIIESQ